jgi:hypothetical protein
MRLAWPRGVARFPLTSAGRIFEGFIAGEY